MYIFKFFSSVNLSKLSISPTTTRQYIASPIPAPVCPSAIINMQIGTYTIAAPTIGIMEVTNVSANNNTGLGLQR